MRVFQAPTNWLVAQVGQKGKGNELVTLLQPLDSRISLAFGLQDWPQLLPKFLRPSALEYQLHYGPLPSSETLGLVQSHAANIQVSPAIRPLVGLLSLHNRMSQFPQ